MDFLLKLSNIRDINQKAQFLGENVNKHFILIFVHLLQYEEFIDSTHNEIKKISEDVNLSIETLNNYYILIKIAGFDSVKEKLYFFNNFKSDIVELFTNELLHTNSNSVEVLRQFFDLYSSTAGYYERGLRFFEQFHEIIKNQAFNSVKAFLFFFAYQTKKYGSPAVKEILRQELINATINNRNEYLDFCMYCFFKGLYHIEKKNYFMAAYLYSTALYIGLNNLSDNMIVFNGFSLQMTRALCFLRCLSDFNTSEFIFRRNKNNILDNIQNYQINEYIGFLKKDKVDLYSFNNFIKNKDYKDYKLTGLKNECLEVLILKKLREKLSLYKKIKLTKLAQLIEVDFKDLLRTIKKKCIEGELNVKYDEETDVLEVLDIDPGKLENVKKTQELYKQVIEGNKNIFISTRDKKLKELVSQDIAFNSDLAQLTNMFSNIHINNINDDDSD